MTKIAIIEDQALVRAALCALLNLESKLKVVAQAENGKHALELIATNTPDLILTDIEMPEMNGIELTREVKEKFPNIRVVIMTTFSRTGYIRRAMEAGADAFILKEAPSTYLIDTIQKVMLGKKVIDPELALSALDDLDPLTEKERKALYFAGQGLKTKEIAKKLFLTEGTVRNYLSEAISKLNASNRIDAVRIAQQKGWL